MRIMVIHYDKPIYFTNVDRNEIIQDHGGSLPLAIVYPTKDSKIEGCYLGALHLRDDRY